jgi:GNAT superfamily N-acetyltransferase
MDGRKNSLFLSDLYVKKQFRGTGVGSAVMLDIVAFADNNHIPIVLIPEPEGRLSVKKLILFYSKFGFVVNRGKNVDYFLSEPFVLSMYRVPR